jgi:2-polyprenyl-3-methyl-5-hydroxy-6-metoxy-1,4-benzoquinol methylase
MDQILNPYYLNQRKEVAAFIPSNMTAMRVLEIGCGVGNFKENIDGNSEYWGIEPSLDVANIAATKLFKVLVGRFEDVYMFLPNDYFDCVVCNDVIEHMANEDWFLTTIKTKMKRKSVIVGSVPNVRYIDNLLHLIIRKDWRYLDSGILDRTHLRFFTEKSLKRSFESNQYDILSFYGINQFPIDRRNFKVLCKSLTMRVLSYLIGKDSRYLQFGFCISPR